MSTTTATAIANVRRSGANQRRKRRREVIRASLTPPPDLLVSEWSDNYRILSPESSAEPGPWQTDRAPYLKAILDAFADPFTEEVVWMACSQVGKTEVVLNLTGYYVDQDPAPLMVVFPTEKIGESWSKDRLAPMLRDTPKRREDQRNGPENVYVIIEQGGEPVRVIKRKLDRLDRLSGTTRIPEGMNIS